MAPSFDTIGWFSNNIKTFQKIGEVLLDKNENENITFNQFVIAEDLLELVDTDIKNQFDSYYKELHPNIKHIRLSKFSKSEIADNFRILQAGEIKEHVIPWIEKNKPKISLEINSRIEMASEILPLEIDAAKTFRQEIISEINNSLPEGDIAIFPTTPFSAPKCGQSDQDLGSDRKKIMEMTSIAGMTSRPQISIPKFKGKTGPVGISILGWQNSDEILLNKLSEI